MTKETYSFSRLSSWHQCEAEWKFKYIDSRPFKQNWWAEVGTVAHECVEDFILGKVARADLHNHFLSKYWSIKLKPPFPNMGSAMDRDLGNYFETRFKGFSLTDMKVEESISVDMGDWTLNGFIDLYGWKGEDIMMIDHKVSNPLSSSWETAKKVRQLYLYSAHIKEVYGKYPKLLSFNFMKGSGDNKPNPKYAIHVPFDETKMEEAVSWANDTVALIRKAKADEDYMFSANYDEFYREKLCGISHECSIFLKINDLKESRKKKR